MRITAFGSEPAFLGGAPGSGEVILLFLVVLVFFGPRRLPEIARMIGRALEQLRRASQDFRDQVMRIDEEAPIDVIPGDDQPREAGAVGAEAASGNAQPDARPMGAGPGSPDPSQEGETPRHVPIG